jgi:hypothetical protein
MKNSFTSSHADIHKRAPWLAHGVNGFVNAQGDFVCTGSRMGRKDCIPADFRTVRQIIVERVPSVVHDYDKGGAYWGDVKGRNGCAPLFCAWGDSDTEQAETFFRARGLRDAKKQAQAAFPNAEIIKRRNILA